MVWATESKTAAHRGDGMAIWGSGGAEPARGGSAEREQRDARHRQPGGLPCFTAIEHFQNYVETEILAVKA